MFWLPSGFSVMSWTFLSALSSGVQVEGRRLDEVDLAGPQRIDGLQVVGHGVPFDAVDLGDLAAGQAARRLGARLVVADSSHRPPGDRASIRRA